jgi:hypothetical protein
VPHLTAFSAALGHNVDQYDRWRLRIRRPVDGQVTALFGGIMALLNLPGSYRRGEMYRVPTPVKSMASIIAIICAVASFIVPNAAGKLVLALVAMVAGLVGMLRAAHPNVSGGILSIVALVVAVFGVLVAIFDALLF